MITFLSGVGIGVTAGDPHQDSVVIVGIEQPVCGGAVLQRDHLGLNAHLFEIILDQGGHLDSAVNCWRTPGS